MLAQNTKFGNLLAESPLDPSCGCLQAPGNRLYLRKDGQTDKQTNRQAEIQTNGQTEMKNRQTDNKVAVGQVEETQTDKNQKTDIMDRI